MHRGFIRTWRRAMDSAIFKDQAMWQMASWAMMKATFKQRSTTFKNKETGRSYKVTLSPGQFVTGRFKGSEELGIHPSSFYRRLKKLAAEPYEFIRVDARPSYTIVTVLNWSRYQSNNANT